jgi:DNA-binding PadR family transcriptional regulator
LVILAIVAATPMHGYDLMAELARLFGPRYRPSAGSIYPAVEALASEGLLTDADVDGRRVYSVTALGSEALTARAGALAAVEVRTGVHLSNRPRIDAALTRFETRVRAVANRLDPDTLDQLLDDAADTIAGSVGANQPENQ